MEFTNGDIVLNAHGDAGIIVDDFVQMSKDERLPIEEFKPAYAFRLHNEQNTMTIDFPHNTKSVGTAMLQGALNFVGYSCGSVDGIRGPQTDKAITAFCEACNCDESTIIKYILEF